MNTDTLDDSPIPLTEHFKELKTRLIVAIVAWLIAFIACYSVIDTIYAFLVEPLAEQFADQEGRRLIYTGLTEAFFTYIKLAAYTALFIAFPIIATQAYLFMAPGLYKKEKWALIPYLIVAPLLFFAGAGLAYFGVLPMAWQFFISFETPATSASAIGLPINLEAKVSEYLSLVIQIVFAFGLAFQLPLALTLLVRTGIMRRETLQKGRKYAVILIITAAALLTPPDIISQIALFIPLYLLYEMAIMITGFQKPKKSE